VAAVPACICVEVVYATQDRAVVKSYRLVPPVRIADALRAAAADPDFSGVDLWNSPVGVYGRRMAPDHPIKHGDRVEIYRPLAADPKTARRARARQKS
jgi:putative ubiquitin-RnfH superfamily antitoxin RatB of RatAB toxin-antitoxin module